MTLARFDGVTKVSMPCALLDLRLCHQCDS